MVALEEKSVAFNHEYLYKISCQLIQYLKFQSGPELRTNQLANIASITAIHSGNHPTNNRLSQSCCLVPVQVACW